jgi:hypothetical protein
MGQNLVAIDPYEDDNYKITVVDPKYSGDWKPKENLQRKVECKHCKSFWHFLFGTENAISTEVKYHDGKCEKRATKKPDSA